MLKVRVYCWNCGEQLDASFYKCKPYNKNMGKDCCSYCNTKIHALWEDLVELENRQNKRGIPRL